MPKRSLVLNRESLSTLESDELQSVAGAISAPHPLCVLTSVRYSYCNTCGIACTYDCGTTS